MQDGVNPGESIIVAGGGAAGLNIIPIAEALGCRRVLLPRTAGALSACGGQFSNIVTEFSASRYAHSERASTSRASARRSPASPARMDAFEQELRSRGIARFEREYFVEARYINQQWEMEIPMPMDRFESQRGRGAAGGDLPRRPLPPLRSEGGGRRHRVHQLEGPHHRLSSTSPRSRRKRWRKRQPRRRRAAPCGPTSASPAPWTRPSISAMICCPGMVVAGPGDHRGAHHHDRGLSRARRRP